MKKLALSLVVGAALALTPLSSFALTAMSTDNMKDATGQAGVSIAVDDIALYQTIGETMYIDTTGDNGLVTDTAAITISEKATFTTIRALLDDTDRDGYLKTAFQDPNDASHDGYYTIMHGTADANVGKRTGTDLEGDAFVDLEIAALSIDVSSAALVSTKINNTDGDAANDGDIAAVVIGLPTIEICKTGSTQQIGITACKASDGTYEAGDKNTFIQIEKTDSVLTILGGVLEIAAH